MVKQGNLPLSDEEPRLRLAIQNADGETGKLSDEQPPEGRFATNNSAENKRDPKLLLRSDEDEIDAENQTVGTHLRQERERQDYSLHEVAEILRLRPRQLQALEDGNYDALPGQTFVTGFLRSYANVLGLDAVAVVDLYRSENSGDVGVPELAFPQPTSEGRMPGIGLLVGCCFIAVLVVVGWYFYLDENSLDIEIVPELPEALIEKLKSSNEFKDERIVLPNVDGTQAATIRAIVPVIKPTAVTVKKPENEEKIPVLIAEIKEPSVMLEKDAPLKPFEPKVDAYSVKTEEPANAVVSVPVIDAKIEEPLAESAPKLENVIAIVETTPQEAVASSQILEPAVTVENTAYPQQKLEIGNLVGVNDISVDEMPEAFGVENTDARLVLVARQESWVQIIAGDKDIILDRILGAGDTFMLPLKLNMVLNTANAGGLELRLDGKPLGVLGGYGEIIRSLSLEPAQLKDQLSALN